MAVGDGDRVSMVWGVGMSTSRNSQPIDSFDDALESLVRFAGVRVDVRIAGTGRRGRTVASLSGALERGGLSEPPGRDIDDKVLVRATTFHVGDQPENYVSLWPDRFVRATSYEWPDAVEIVMQDAIVTISRRQPWID